MGNTGTNHLNKLDIKTLNTRCADMGGLCGKGYDDNALIFEMLKSNSSISRISIINPSLNITPFLRYYKYI